MRVFYTHGGLLNYSMSPKRTHDDACTHPAPKQPKKHRQNSLTISLVRRLAHAPAIDLGSDQHRCSQTARHAAVNVDSVRTDPRNGSCQVRNLRCFVFGQWSIPLGIHLPKPTGRTHGKSATPDKPPHRLPRSIDETRHDNGYSLTSKSGTVVSGPIAGIVHVSYTLLASVHDPSNHMIEPRRHSSHPCVPLSTCHSHISQLLYGDSAPSTPSAQPICQNDHHVSQTSPDFMSFNSTQSYHRRTESQATALGFSRKT